MSDSFFTARNQFDEQMGSWPAWLAQQMIEAGSRRIIRPGWRRAARHFHLGSCMAGFLMCFIIDRVLG